jgi:hypothetical protein
MRHQDNVAIALQQDMIARHMFPIHLRHVEIRMTVLGMHKDTFTRGIEAPAEDVLGRWSFRSKASGSQSEPIDHDQIDGKTLARSSATCFAND